MAAGNKRKKILEAKRNRKATEMKSSGGKSNYARKRSWLKAHGDIFGFEVPNPKPWKVA